MKPAPYQAVFFDIDGTLVSHRTGSIPQSAKETLLALHERGVRLFVSTGRHISEIRRLAGILDFPWDGLITLNGQYCFDGKTPYYAQAIEPEDVARLIRRSRELQIPCKFVEEDRMYVSAHTDVVRRVQADIHTPLPELGDLSHGLTHPVYLVVTYCTPAQQKELLAPLGHVRSTLWNPFAFDVIHEDGSKENGVRMTCRRYGIPLERTMAFGDGENDADMLRCVGMGIAMGNGAEVAKKAARFVTRDIDEDGVAWAVRRFGLLPG